MIIENIQFAKLVDRTAIVLEELLAVHEFTNKTTDSVKRALGHMQFMTLVDRYTALAHSAPVERRIELGQLADRRMDEMQLERGEQMRRLRMMREQEREELAMLGLIAA